MKNSGSNKHDREDCLDLFKLSPVFTEEELKKAYLKLMQLYHPDKFAYDEDAFQKANAMAKDNKNQGAMTGANRELGKMCGYYEPETKQIEFSQTGGMGHFRYLESLSDEVLMEMLGEEGMCPK